jgi:DNA-binding Lrp family transcriptional regulator
MPTALVCITTDFDSIGEVLAKLRACEGVEEAFMVHGVYDIIAKVNGDTLDGLKKTVAEKIKKIGNVQKTLTMMMVAEAK